MGAQNTIRLAAAGYRNAASATVTQLTSKSTAVTINAQAGVITTDNAQINLASEVSFTVNNTSVGATDCIVVSISSGATNTDDHSVYIGAVADGSFVIGLANHSTSNRSDTLVINFAIIGGSS